MTTLRWLVTNARTGAEIASKTVDVDTTTYNLTSQVFIQTMIMAGKEYVTKNAATLPDVVRLTVINDTGHNEMHTELINVTSDSSTDIDLANPPPFKPPPSPPMDLSWLLYLGLGIAIIAVIYWAYRSGLT